MNTGVFPMLAASVPKNSNLIFKINPSDQINEMSKIVGYDIRMISPDFGNA